MNSRELAACSQAIERGFHFKELTGCPEEAGEGAWGLALTRGARFFCSRVDGFNQQSFF